MSVYEIPAKRRRMVTLDEVEAHQEQAQLVETLIDLIETDERVRAAILAAANGSTPRARQKRPTTMTPRMRARGGR